MNPKDLLCGEYKRSLGRVEFCKIRPMTGGDVMTLGLNSDQINAECCDGCNCALVTSEPTTKAPTTPNPTETPTGCKCNGRDSSGRMNGNGYGGRKCAYGMNPGPKARPWCVIDKTAACADKKKHWDGWYWSEIACIPTTAEPTLATQEPTDPPTCPQAVQVEAEVTCDKVLGAISSGKCTLPTEAETTTTADPTIFAPTKVTCDKVLEAISSGTCTLPTEAETTETITTADPTTAAPTKEMLWRVEGADRCPLAYKLGIWGHFGKPKNTKKCEKKCTSHPDCVAISYKTANRACTGFSSCPFFENTDEFGGNEGWINIRVKPEPVTSSAFSASFTAAREEEEEFWTVARTTERALAVTGAVMLAALGWNHFSSSKSDAIYVQVDPDL